MPRQSCVDYAVHKELDHTLINIGYERALQDIRSRQHLQVGRTTHFIQELLLTPPLFKRTSCPTSPTLPRTVWDDVDLAGATMAALLNSLQQRMLSLPTYAHVYSPTNLVSPPYTETELHFDIFTRRDSGANLMFGLNSGVSNFGESMRPYSKVIL